MAGGRKSNVQEAKVETSGTQRLRRRQKISPSRLALDPSYSRIVPNGDVGTLLLLA